MLYRAALLATGLFSLSMATVTITVESTVTVCPCTTPGSLFGSATAPATKTTLPSGPSSTSSISSATPTCALLGASCDDNAVVDQCCTGLGYYCSGGKCTDDDQVEGTSDNDTPAAGNAAPAPVPSTTTSATASQSTCGLMFGASCDDNAEIDQCCTDIGLYCSGGSCTDDDAVEASA